MCVSNIKFYMMNDHTNTFTHHVICLICSVFVANILYLFRYDSDVPHYIPPKNKYSTNGMNSGVCVCGDDGKSFECDER